jgi:rhamnogalacturonyl hydrolase YesR
VKSFILPLAVFAILVGAAAAAPPHGADHNARVAAALSEVDWPGVVRIPIGVTRQGTLLWCLMDPQALTMDDRHQRIAIIGALDGTPEALRTALHEVPRILKRQHPEQLAIACVPLANPDGWLAGTPGENGRGGRPTRGYPPQGTAYNSPTDPEAHAIWRFLGWFAPDVVIEVHSDRAPEFAVGPAEGPPRWPEDCLAHQVRRSPVAGIGVAQSLRVVSASDDTAHPLELFRGVREAAYGRSGAPDPLPSDRSPLRRAMEERLRRSPAEVAGQLCRHYGDHLNVVMYQPALALVARLRLGGLTEDSSQLRDIEQIVTPYALRTVPSLPAQVSGSHLAGHLLFVELARVSRHPRYVELAQQAADQGFDDQGAPREAMPFHNEMSDAVFMGCPILTGVGQLTGELRYFAIARAHLRFMRPLVHRPDGISRHSPLCEAAWGRGNGFPALGLALCLADLDAALGRDVAQRDQAELTGRSARIARADRQELEAIRAEFLSEYRDHLTALLVYQDPTGMWRQVIDHPGSYRELTATCMITYALVRGIRQGWLDETAFGPAARRSWEAIKLRVGPDGQLFDVCTGTGKQPTLQHYLDRTAILGPDERGGAMALLCAVEMLAWESGEDGS